MACSFLTLGTNYRTITLLMIYPRLPDRCSKLDSRLFIHQGVRKAEP